MHLRLYYLSGALLLIRIIQINAFTNGTALNFLTNISNFTKEYPLLSSLFKNCKNPSVSCVRKSVYQYFNETFDYKNEFQVGDFIKFTKNSVDYSKLQRPALEEDENEVLSTASTARSSPLVEVTHSLHKKALKFMMTHDLELKLPETFFEGSTLKIQPRSFDGDGTILKMEIEPKTPEKLVAEPRILFKKIKKAIGEKLMMALLAILMVIKLLAVKLLFFLPAVVGVATAKKLILKFVLFLFPALHAIFKLCPYVPHGNKFHIHKHQISHIHHVPPHHHHPPHVEIEHGHEHGPTEYLPSIHHHTDVKFTPHDPLYKPHEKDLEFYADGPSFTHEFITHRKVDGKKPIIAQDNEVQPWISGQGQREKKPSSFNRPLTPNEIENIVLKAEKEALLKAKLQQEHLRVQAENIRLQHQIKQALKLQDKLKQAMMVNLVPPVPAQGGLTNPSAPTLQSSYMPNPPTTLITQPHQQFSPSSQIIQTQTIKPETLRHNSTQNSVQTVHSASGATYDPFYSPILAKIDKILVGLGYFDEPCRERLICSMYKNPPKFSPHSNLLSTELSRDASELQKPTSSNAAVIRFYKYVQAARDGQDQRECLKLYPCSINTEV